MRYITLLAALSLMSTIAFSQQPTYFEGQLTYKGGVKSTTEFIHAGNNRITPMGTGQFLW